MCKIVGVEYIVCLGLTIGRVIGQNIVGCSLKEIEAWRGAFIEDPINLSFLFPPLHLNKKTSPPHF